MTDKEKIRAEVKKRKDELHYMPFTDENLGKMNAYGYVLKIIDSLPEESASKGLEGAAENHALQCHSKKASVATLAASIYDFRAGANWRQEHLWHDAQGDDLPAIDREVIAFQGGKVVIAHRPDPAGWDGKSLSTGEVEHYTPQTYGKGGWNMPDVKYWLDAELPKGIE